VDRQPAESAVRARNSEPHLANHFGTGLSIAKRLRVQRRQAVASELLDWLAGEFIRSGWSLKKLHKMILLSKAYRQASTFRAEAAKLDCRKSVTVALFTSRLQGEVVRDAMLFASGKLNPKIGGSELSAV